MSAYIKMATQYNDQECLVGALKSMGYSPEVHTKAVQLVDYVGKKRPETAEIVIPRSQVGGASNEIGFKLQEDGTYQRISSQFDNNSQRLSDTSLKCRYAEKKAMKDGEARGLKLVERITGKNGAVRLRFEQAKIAGLR